MEKVHLVEKESGEGKGSGERTGSGDGIVSGAAQVRETERQHEWLAVWWSLVNFSLHLSPPPKYQLPPHPPLTLPNLPNAIYRLPPALLCFFCPPPPSTPPHI